MTVQEVAEQLVQFCREGKFHAAIEALYSPEIVSVEAGAPPGGSRETKGLEGVRGKADWWMNNHEVHAFHVDGPMVAGVHFAVGFRMEVTFKPSGQRFAMDEIALYKVADGKIVYEEFFYQM